MADLIHQDDEETMNIENAAITRSKVVDSTYMVKYNIWRRDYENDNADSTLRLIRDQIITALVYASIVIDMEKVQEVKFEEDEWELFDLMLNRNCKIFTILVGFFNPITFSTILQDPPK